MSCFAVANSRCLSLRLLFKGEYICKNMYFINVEVQHAKKASESSKKNLKSNIIFFAQTLRATTDFDFLHHKSEAISVPFCLITRYFFLKCIGE